MKKLSFLFVLMLLVSTFTSSFVFADENSEDKLKLVALGDSITYGSGLDDKSSQRFSSLIGNGIFVDENLGVPGATSSDLVKGLAEAAEAIQSADVITLTIGGNDLLQNDKIKEILQTQTINLTPQELAVLGSEISTTYTQNLQKIIAGIRTQTDAPIVLYTIYNPFGPNENEPFKSVHALGKQILGFINSTVDGFIKSNEKNLPGLLVADAYTAFEGKQSDLMIAGDVHPNSTGHQVLAGLANDLLLNLINPTPPVEEPGDEEPAEENPDEENPTPPVDKDQKVLVSLGDSITFGYTLENRDLAFPHLLGADMDQVLNFGFPGYTSSQLLTEIRENNQISTGLQHADLVTLNIGNNDLLQAAGISDALGNQSPVTVTPELQKKIEEATVQFGQNLQVIISSIRAQTQAPIILYNLYNPFGESDNEYQNSFHLLGEQIVPTINNKVINPIAFQNNALVADAYTAFAGKQATFITADPVHPNELGHQALAKAGLEAAIVTNPVPPVVVDPVEEEPPVVVDPVDPEKEEPSVVAPPVEDDKDIDEDTDTDKDTDKDEDKETPAPKSNDSGKKLPNTATAMFNYLAMGAVLLLAGAILLFVQYRRRLSETR